MEITLVSYLIQRLFLRGRRAIDGDFRSAIRLLHATQLTLHISPPTTARWKSDNTRSKRRLAGPILLRLVNYVLL